MTDTVIMPQLGETVAEGKILAWFKSVGDEIREGDNLFEVETDKVTLEVQSIVAGRLNEIRVAAGIVAKVGEVVAIVGGEAAAATRPSTVEAPAAPAGALPSARPSRRSRRRLESFGSRQGTGRRSGDAAGASADRAERPRSRQRSPPTREQRGESKIDEKAVRAAIDDASSRRRPSPRRGRLRRRRLARPGRDGEVIALNAIRVRTAERLAENWRTIPHVFQAIDVDFTALDRVRRQRKDAFRTAHGFSLTYLPFIARATCLAIQAFPQINARFAGKALIAVARS